MTFSLLSAEQERRELQLNTGAPSGCFRLPVPARSSGRRSWAPCPGWSHRAQAGATVPWQQREPGTALAMELGPPANGAGVRFSTQLQVRAHLAPGAARHLPALHSAASSSARSACFQPGGFSAALDPSARGEFCFSLG